ncbi:hypothetical protein P3L10_013482 [Capsicum annuum]
MAFKVLISLFMLWAISASIPFVVEARNVAFVHCNNDEDCLNICKVVWRPFCYNRLCICNRDLFCFKDKDCDHLLPSCPLHKRCYLNICNCG